VADDNPDWFGDWLENSALGGADILCESQNCVMAVNYLPKPAVDKL
jgi:hypothetical protein